MAAKDSDVKLGANFSAKKVGPNGASPMINLQWSFNAHPSIQRDNWYLIIGSSWNPAATELRLTKYWSNNEAEFLGGCLERYFRASQCNLDPGAVEAVLHPSSPWHLDVLNMIGYKLFSCGYVFSSTSGSASPKTSAISSYQTSSSWVQRWRLLYKLTWQSRRHLRNKSWRAFLVRYLLSLHWPVINHPVTGQVTTKSSQSEEDLKLQIKHD